MSGLDIDYLSLIENHVLKTVGQSNSISIISSTTMKSTINDNDYHLVSKLRLSVISPFLPSFNDKNSVQCVLITLHAIIIVMILQQNQELLLELQYSECH